MALYPTMARGVKRKRRDHDESRRQNPGSSPHVSPVHRDLLQQCFPKVQTLRAHAISKLPGSSRLRRKKIASLGQRNGCGEAESTLAQVLDTALVCSSDGSPGDDGSTYQQFLSFSQQADDSYVSLSDGESASVEAQSEIVDFVIWLLFKRHARASTRPKHLLCGGFHRKAREGDVGGSRIPGIYCLHPNTHVAALKQAPWTHLLALLGQSGQRIMVDLLVDCSIFVSLEAGLGNYYQLSGFPLSEMDLSGYALSSSRKAQTTTRKLSDIVLLRRHIFYAKASSTALGGAQRGYGSGHVLNRYPHVGQSLQLQEDTRLSTEMCNEFNTRKVMMSIFPRQFGLCNVFTSDFQDYSLRDGKAATLVLQGNEMSDAPPPKLPRRLRGAVTHLVRRLQILHSRCSYAHTLHHYCPTHLDRHKESKRMNTGQDAQNGGGISCPQPVRTSPPSRQKSLVDLACPPSCVSAFCQAVLSKVVPDEFWGAGDTLWQNKAAFLRKVDHFIKMRRFESMTLHEISQGLKVADLTWLRPPDSNGQRLNQSDANKRREIFHEFLYYVFDSLLIPLIRCSFYVTESGTHRYQIFYFRHDVWASIAKSTIAELKGDMFEEIGLDEAQRILDSRRLGYGHLRLLPKGEKIRLITNLRKINQGRASSRALGASVNSVLRPIHAILNFEKNDNHGRLGSSLCSVGDVHQRLRAFKTSLGFGHGRLYMAKVDVHAAFDTMSQAAVVKVMSGVFNRRDYTVTKHAEVQPGERSMPGARKPATGARKQWCASASAEGQEVPLFERLKDRPGCLLMRLIDDFLLITLDKSKAIAFVRSMHRGFPDYGVEANQKKTLVNFDMQIDGDAVPRVPAGSGLSYCGMLINDQSLGISKSRMGHQEAAVSSLLTVDFGRTPGQNFQRKTIATFKARAHFMFYDTSHNSRAVVFQSLGNAFGETCRRMVAYIRCLPRAQQPHVGLVIQTMIKVVEAAVCLLSSKSRRLQHSHSAVGISKARTCTIAYAAFLEVLVQKQTGFGPVISWLQRQQTTRQRDV